MDRLSKPRRLMGIVASLLMSSVAAEATAKQIINLDAAGGAWAGAAPTSFVVPVTNPGVPSPAMWACTTAGCDPQEAGRNTARFTATFDLGGDPDAAIIGRFKILADDLLVFRSNGNFVFSAVKGPDPLVPLDFSIYSVGDIIRFVQNNAGEAPPFAVSDFDLAFTRGLNTVTIEAYDGYNLGEGEVFPLPPGVTCESRFVVPGTDAQIWCVADRGLNWVFVDGEINAVPEPAMLTLVCLGFGALAFARRHRAPAAV
ncbi:MAG: hypothetical protein JNK67_21445 [Alphaproteobacteria bacterium]|nr:hypothetical protein [Alphaproteobacteria bacterium]